MTVRTRMAPSPTGEFHIGGMRTLLYSYAFAKKHNGKFVLRIEDTDRERFVEGATERIYKVIEDYGLDWDEGPKKSGESGPYVQSERLEIYKEHVEELIENGHAYYCFCTKERLNELRESQQEQKLPTTKYDKACLKISKEDAFKRVESGEEYVVRLNVPEDTEVEFEDKVLGKISINTNDIDDQVLLKSDGFPTYHLAVVVDDHLMGITHVIRGMEWLPSTPKHVLIYKAFGWDLPVYAHVPLLKEKGGTKKLSKREGSVMASEFLAAGYLPEALLNFLMFLGWNPGTEKEIYTLEEFIQDFSLEKIHKTDLVVFDREKLLWMNGMYIRNMSLEGLYKRVVKWSEKYEIRLPKEFLDEVLGKKILGLIQERLKVFNEINDLISYFFSEPNVEKDLLLKFAGSDKHAIEILNVFIEKYEQCEDWGIDNLDKISHELITTHQLTPKEAFMTVRVAVSGRKATPPLFDMLQVLGKDTTVKRLKAVLTLL